MSIPISFSCQATINASLQWLKLKCPIPSANLGGSPGFAIMGISNGFKLKRVPKDCLI